MLAAGAAFAPVRLSRSPSAKQLSFSAAGSPMTPAFSVLEIGAGPVESQPEAERRSSAYERSWSQRWRRQVTLERVFEEREAYREERRLAAQEARLEPRHQRARQWRALLCAAAACAALARHARAARAAAVLGRLWLPLWRRWWALHRRRRQRRNTAAELTHCLAPPTVSILRGCALFDSWPRDATRQLVATLQPMQFHSGDFIILEGDPGDRMYFLISGTVDVIVRNRGVCKSRARHNGTVVATLGPGAYFGEYALVNDECRMASVQCMQPAVCWALQRSAFQAALLRFPADDPVRVRMVVDTLQRRNAVMARLHPITPKQLQGVPMLAGWSPDSLQALAAGGEPHAVPAGHVLLAEGSPPDCMYFIACGRVQLWKKTGWWRQAGDGSLGTRCTVDGRMWDPELGELLSTLGRGDVVGEVGVVTLEPHPYTAQAVALADLWRLPRQRCKDLLLSAPLQFLRAKELATLKWAAWLDPLPPAALQPRRPLLQALLGSGPALLRAVHDALVPLVACPGDAVACAGLLLVTAGTLEGARPGQLVRAGQVAGAEWLQCPVGPAPTLRACSLVQGWLLPQDRVLMLQRKFLRTGPPEGRLTVGLGRAGLRLRWVATAVAACVRLRLLAQRLRPRKARPLLAGRANLLAASPTPRHSGSVAPIEPDASHVGDASQAAIPSDSAGSSTDRKPPPPAQPRSPTAPQPNSPAGQSPHNRTRNGSHPVSPTHKPAGSPIKFAAGFMRPGFAAEWAAHSQPPPLARLPSPTGVAHPTRSPGAKPETARPSPAQLHGRGSPHGRLGAGTVLFVPRRGSRQA